MVLKLDYRNQMMGAEKGLGKKIDYLKTTM